ncbi:uncharacterized protein LOC129322231 [Prosopis cineraria]|uniref:uncharacterized protein LOC129322231 n=1 Tax=Prosopis cineraria TaxID=364024 RepID=UPI00240F1899|nr:uncharacterized protein LOC129322231 [Prosopis cineraria]
MATLQKFKLLATHCGMARSPTRSPRASPMVQFRRRKTTLRMLLNRNMGRQSPRRRNSPIQQNHLFGVPEERKKEKRKELMRRNSLKELFVSSPPKEEANTEIPTRRLDSVGTVVGIGGPVVWSNGPGSPKPVWRGFRIRSLLKKGWHPGLQPISE